MDIDPSERPVIDSSSIAPRGGFADLYRLGVEQVAELARLAEKSARNLVDAISGSRTRGLGRLLNALGSRLVGERAAHLLATRFGTMARLQAASAEELAHVHGIGPQIAESVRKFSTRPRTQGVIRSSTPRGGPTERAALAGPGPLEGKSFVLTGPLPTLTRDTARDLVLRAGGRVVGSMSRKTDYVVVGDAPGSKADDAQRLGVAVLDEAAFLALVRQA